MVAQLIYTHVWNVQQVSNDTFVDDIYTYIKQSYSFRPLTLSRDFHTFEHQEIFADANRCKFCVVSNYQPPDTNLSNLLSEFDEYIQWITLLLIRIVSYLSQAI